MTTVELLATGWAAVTAIGVAVLILCTRRSSSRGRFGPDRVTRPRAVPSSPEAGLLPFASRELDVQRELGAAVSALRDLAVENLVELQVVLQPGLKVWSDPYALRQVMTEALSGAIQRTGGGVLLGAQWHGGRVQVTVTDDGVPGDPMCLRAALRHVEEFVALQGGTLEISCTAARGNVVTLRLPGVGDPTTLGSDDMPTEEPRVRDQPRGRAVRKSH